MAAAKSQGASGTAGCGASERRAMAGGSPAIGVRRVTRRA